MQTEKVQIKTPLYLYDQALDRYIYVNEEGDIVEIDPITITLHDHTTTNTQARVQAIYNTAHSCTVKQFEDVLNGRLFKIGEVIGA
jgi:hypothetical protein